MGKILLSSLKKALLFLQGKKATLFSLAAAFMSYFAAEGIINNNQLVLFNAVLVALGFTVNVATRKLIK